MFNPHLLYSFLYLFFHFCFAFCYAVSIVQNPTISLADNIAATKRIIEKQSGPVILVGHSYGER